jgi:hypothetical protein
MKLPISLSRGNRRSQPASAPASQPVNKSARNTVSATEAITQSQAISPAPLGAYEDAWAETVLHLSNTDVLSGPQNAIVFGAKVMGRQAVMLRLANLINARFAVDHHAAVYADIQQRVSASTMYSWTSVDSLYRGLVVAPMDWARDQLHIREDRELQKIIPQLDALLNVPVSKLNMLAVRDAFLRWLDHLGIQELALFIDDVTALAPEFVPVLLQMLLDTFPRGGRVSMKIGGLKHSLKLEERARRGGLGLQFNHDILTGLDLEQMLQAPDVSPSPIDPRQVFLLACLRKHAPAIAARVQSETAITWDALFEPADLWFRLFSASGWDVNVVGIAAENLLAALSSAERTKAEAPQVDQAVERAKVQVGVGVRAQKTTTATTAPAR